METEDQERLEALARKGHKGGRATDQQSWPPWAPHFLSCTSAPPRHSGSEEPLAGQTKLQRSPGPVLQQREKRETASATCMVLKCLVPHFSSVQSLSCVWLLATPWTAACQASLPIANSRSLPKLMSIDRWCHPTISSSVVPFSSPPQSFPASGSFQMSQPFASGGQSIGVSASTSVLPMNTQDWSPLGWTGWLYLQSKGLSRVFSNTTVQKHQFFCA